MRHVKGYLKIQTSLKDSENLIEKLKAQGIVAEFVSTSSNRCFSDDQVREIRSSRLPPVELAKRYGVHVQTMRNLLDETSYRHVR